MPILLLQKPHHTSKLKDHIACLERRLKTQKEGDLVIEGRTIQQRIPKNRTPKDEQHLACNFAKLMFEGKITATLRLITNQEKGGILHINDTINTTNSDHIKVRTILKSKHPPGPQPSWSLSSKTQKSHPTVLIPLMPL